MKIIEKLLENLLSKDELLLKYYKNDYELLSKNDNNENYKRINDNIKRDFKKLDKSNNYGNLTLPFIEPDAANKIYEIMKQKTNYDFKEFMNTKKDFHKDIQQLLKKSKEESFAIKKPIAPNIIGGGHPRDVGVDRAAELTDAPDEAQDEVPDDYEAPDEVPDKAPDEAAMGAMSRASRAAVVDALPIATQEYAIDTRNMQLEKTYHCISPMNQLAFAHVVSNGLTKKKNKKLYKYKITNNGNRFDMFFDKQVRPNSTIFYRRESLSSCTHLIWSYYIDFTQQNIMEFKCYTGDWAEAINPYLYDEEYLDRIREPTPDHDTIPPYGDFLIYEFPYCRKANRNANQNPAPITTKQDLQNELQYKIDHYDYVFINKCTMTDKDEDPNKNDVGIYFNNEFFPTLFRGQKYNFNWLQYTNGYAYKIKNFLSTTIKIKDHNNRVNLSFMNFICDPDEGIGFSQDKPGYIFQINPSPGIPYVSFDSSPFTSFYSHEKEVLLPRDCMVTTSDPDGTDAIMQSPDGRLLYVKIIQVNILWPYTEKAIKNIRPQADRHRHIIESPPYFFRITRYLEDGIVIGGAHAVNRLAPRRTEKKIVHDADSAFAVNLFTRGRERIKVKKYKRKNKTKKLTKTKRKNKTKKLTKTKKKNKTKKLTKTKRKNKTKKLTKTKRRKK